MTTKTVTYTVHAVRTSLLDTTGFDGKPQFALGISTVSATGDDNSRYEWEQASLPPPVIGWQFTREVDIPDELPLWCLHCGQQVSQ